MPDRLYMIHGSHPCATVEKAFELKGLPYKRVELPAATQPLIMPLLFGGRTVPAVKFAGGEKIQGSRKILRALEDRVPSPPLYDGPAGAEAILEAERWGDEVFQSTPRRLLWNAFAHHRGAMHAFQDGQRSPKLPKPVVVAASHLIIPIERRINDVSDASVRADLAELPLQLDQVDQYIADGVLDGDQPNAADLQIAPTVALLYAMEDLQPLIAGRPAEAFAFRWFPRPTATVPPGGLPLPSAAQAATLPAD
ncbi:MAG TPA: glutathione S-transferase N-terminal domain-containing protein [Baekduia sp.]